MESIEDRNVGTGRDFIFEFVENFVHGAHSF